MNSFTAPRPNERELFDLESLDEAMVDAEAFKTAEKGRAEASWKNGVESGTKVHRTKLIATAMGKSIAISETKASQQLMPHGHEVE